MKNSVKSASYAKRLSTTREKRQLKSKAIAKIANKSDLIRSFLQKGFSASQIRKKIEDRGLSIYPSEIYRVSKEF